MTQVWSATHINGNFSGGGTATVTYTGAGGTASVYADTGVSSGKYYWESSVTGVSISPFINGGFGFGNTSSSVVNDQFAGAGWDSVGLYFENGGVDAFWVVNSSDVSSFALGFTVASGDVFGFALDLVNNALWFRDVTQGSGWFGVSGSGDPIANTNGFSLVQTNFTVTSGPVVPGATLYNTGDKAFGYFSTASWTGAAPTGFKGFDGAATQISAAFGGKGSLSLPWYIIWAKNQVVYRGAGAFTANATRYSIPAMSAAFAGSGAIATSSRVRVASSAAFSGRGSFFAATRGLLSRGTAVFAGTGSLKATLAIPGHSDLSAAFSGAASLTLSRLTARSRSSAAYSGAGAISGNATVLPSTPIPPIVSTNVVDELGNQIVDELGNILVTEFQPPAVLIAHFSGAGSLATSGPTLLARGLATYFVGAGNFVGDLAQHSAAVIGSASFAGGGSFSVSRPNQLAGGLATYFGAGSFGADLTQHFGVVPVSASFSGAGSLSTSGPNRLVSGLATYLGIGSFGADLTQHSAAVSVAASFAGGGSFSVSRPNQLAGGQAKYSGAGSFGANLTPHLAAVSVAASFSGGGSFSARVVARLSGNARFSGVGTWSVDRIIPTVLARCFGIDIGVFSPPTIGDAPRAGPATASDAALDTAPLIWMRDLEVYFAVGSDAARGLAATSDAAIGKATSSDVPANSIAVSEL